MPFYRLKIKTVDDSIIRFHVREYLVVDDGAFIEFTDQLTGRTYRFPTLNVNIEELGGDDD